MNNKIMIPSVNYHLWKPCNAKCKYCFAKFDDTNDILPKGHLSKEKSLLLLDKIIEAGFKKITFVGGEPTLCKWLPDLIKKAKNAGLTTMITTNGFLLNENYLENLKGYLDWIALSIDSLESKTNYKIGRFTNSITPNRNYYKALISTIKSKGFNLKINTVVSNLNYQENFSSFIEEAYPKRWKIFQVLPIKNQNDKHIDELKINFYQFEHFKNNHLDVSKLGITTVFESNEDMLSSYLMIDPAGRFIDNSTNIYKYSSKILEVGIDKAYSEINIDYKKFLARKGLYNWAKEHSQIINFYRSA